MTREMRDMFLALSGAMLLATGCTPEAEAPAVAPQTDVEASIPASLLTATGAIALSATPAGSSPALTFIRTVIDGGDGMDPKVTLRLEADAVRFLEAEEANHTPFDVAAQAPGGVLASLVGAPQQGSPIFHRVTGQAGEPLICGPGGPQSLTLHEEPDGSLVITGLVLSSFEGEEGPEGVVLSPLPASAVCGRAVYRRSEG